MADGHPNLRVTPAQGGQREKRECRHCNRCRQRASRAGQTLAHYYASNPGAVWDRTYFR